MRKKRKKEEKERNSNRFWGLDEELGPSQLPLTSLKAGGGHNDVDTLLWVTVPVGEGLGGEDPKPPDELVIGLAVGESRTTNADILLQVEVPNLVRHSLVVPVLGLLGFVGLDAANVMRSALHEGLDQQVGLALDLVRGSRGPLAVVLGRVLREEAADEGTVGRKKKRSRRGKGRGRGQSCTSQASKKPILTWWFPA